MYKFVNHEPLKGMFGCEKVIGKGKNMSKKMILYLDAIEERREKKKRKR